jgi:hypothetical protein
MTTRDDELVQAQKALDHAVEAYNAAKAGVDRFDTFKLLGLQSDIAKADRRLNTLRCKEEAAGGSLRSSAIYFGSDH